MTTPTLTNPPTAPDKYGTSRSVFDAAMQAFLNWLYAAIAEWQAMVTWVAGQVSSITALANATQADRTLAQTAAATVTAANPATNAAAAAASAAAAAVSAGIAQSVSPDSPVRYNTRKITADLTIGSAYNAASVGPIAIAEGVTVTIQDNATWSID